MAIDEETERRIIDLYFNQRKTLRVISKIVKKSSRDIEPAVKEHKQKLQLFKPRILENSYNEGDKTKPKGGHKQLPQQNINGYDTVTTSNSPDSNLAKFVSDNKSERHSYDYDSAVLLQQQLDEVKEENRKLRQTVVFQRLEKRFYDGRGILDTKQMPIIKGEAKENLESVIRRYNIIISDIIKRSEKVPLKLYVVTRTKLLAPIKLLISFKDKYVVIKLDTKRRL